MRSDEVFDSDGAILKGGGVVVNSDNQILLYKGEHTSFSFPKGHVEKGETAEETAVREVYEETGLKTKILKSLPNLEYFNEFVGKNVRVKMFLLLPVSGTLIKENSDDELIWLDYQGALAKLNPENKGQFQNLYDYLLGIKHEL